MIQENAINASIIDDKLTSVLPNRGLKCIALVQ